MYNRRFPHQRCKRVVSALLIILGLGGVTVLMPQADGISSEHEKVWPSAAYNPDRGAYISVAAVDPRHRTIANYFSRRYRIASDALEAFVHAAHSTGHKLGLDPLLILSVIAIESRFNPIAESELGAKGLMQVMPRHHKDKLAKLGGADAVLDPLKNIIVGAQILKDCIRRGGGLEAGLQLYAGAYGDPENQYAQKVMAERERLDQALRRASNQTQRSAAAKNNGTTI